MVAAVIRTQQAVVISRSKNNTISAGERPHPGKANEFEFKNTGERHVARRLLCLSTQQQSEVSTQLQYCNIATQRSPATATAVPTTTLARTVGSGLF
jgi:hypothetical protein